MGTLYPVISDLVCLCGHGRNEHSHYGATSYSPEHWKICYQTCPCYGFTSTLDAERKYTEGQKTLNRLKDQDEEYTQFVKRNHCPKCGKGSHPTIEFHSDIPWYRRNKCKLGLKSEHIHLICDLCKAHYSVKCLDKILGKLGVKLYGDNQ